MQYVRLGRSGLKVSRIALGCMSYGDPSRGFNTWSLDEEASQPFFRQAVELDKRGAEMLFQVLTEREERNSIAIASNEPFSGWTKTFTDPRLCAAIVDRLTFGGNIIETGTESYRLAHTRAKRAAARD